MLNLKKLSLEPISTYMVIDNIAFQVSLQDAKD